MLLVEDDLNLSYLLKDGLEDIIGGYEVKTATNGIEGLALWKEYKPDVIVTDIDMPEMNGFQMVEKIREIDGDTLIFFSSGNIKSKSVLEGFNIGGNEYLKKPYMPQELDVRIKAIMKLKAGSRTLNENETRKIGSLTFDGIKGTLKDAEGNYIHLTVKEANVLKLLALNAGEVVKRDSIIENIWDKENDFYSSRSLDVIVNGLRNKLAIDPSIEIMTVRGVGLKLIQQAK